MPLRDLECLDCKHGWEELVMSGERPTCPKCDGFNVQILLALIGGYQGDMGGASTRPKQSTSFRAKKRTR